MTAVQRGRWRSTPAAILEPPPADAGLRVRLVLNVVGASVAVLACAALAQRLQSGGETALALVAPAGASAVLVFAGSASPYARARNLVVGYLIAALVAVGVRPALGSHVALAAAVCVGATSVLMLLTGTVHPPAGGYALIPILGATSARTAPAWTIVATALVGTLMILVVRLGVSMLDLAIERLWLRPSR